MMWDASSFLSSLTPKFYVALTGTSSLISGLILIFEWWYFKKYGTSFIEQVSLNHLGPWLGGNGDGDPLDLKVWRNPMSLLRGAEYGRLWGAVRRAPLTYYDMNLSAQEHQAWFCSGAGTSGVDETLARAWREREPAARVACARAALALRPDCAAALLLLAEEDAPTVLEAERVLRRAWRAGEASWRSLAAAGSAAAARREAAVLAHVKRRAAMCARRLGRLRDAARLFRELARDAPPALSSLSLHENLIEVLLEQKAYADVQALLARYDDACLSLPRSATVCYTAALLKARAAASSFSTSNTARSLIESALEAARRAIDYNAHVPEYLLELRPLTLPPEHYLRRGDSEAVAYAFWHLRHWRAVDGALELLSVAWTAAGRGAYVTAWSSCADRELLPAHHPPPLMPRGYTPGLLPLAAALCGAAALLAALAQRWPSLALAALDPRRVLLALLAAL
ncbi:protein ST7 homolog [Danaus plexippus]|uniref:protein ST7 homolog n=1 Tax=Danaus plexippus TaxID=13037 RepID=UPI002AB0C4B0|nr:protein ST7 homolog [Danaus plexippus]